VGASDQLFGTITLPTSIVGVILGFYAEMIYGTSEESSGVQNELDGTTYIKTDVNSAGTYDDTVITMTGGIMYHNANQIRAGNTIRGPYIPMSTVTQSFDWGDDIELRWKNSKSKGDILDLFDIQATLYLLVKM
jgi:hypothetical protein